MRNKSYWLETNLIKGDPSSPKSGGLLVIGSGLSGVSAAYWLQKKGLDRLTIVDDHPEKAATFRNCGHILHGTVESMQALRALHGEKMAREIWQFSIDCCNKVGETVRNLGLSCEYRQEGYLVIAIEESELNELRESISMMNSMGFPTHFVEENKLEKMGFRHTLGARYEAGSASAHPVQFRNGLLQHVMRKGARYHSGQRVQNVTESGDHSVVTIDERSYEFDAVVVATNAYTPFLSDELAAKQFVEPFRGQIIVSAPLQSKLPVTYPHSFDHGYQYALGTKDNRLMIGGWRNNTVTGEIGSYKLEQNMDVENGLKHFAQKHYSIKQPIDWDYSWSGIMATSATGLPFIGPVGLRTFLCLGYTGHGFSWAHGSAELLSRIILGETYPEVSKYFNPLAKDS